MITESKQAAPKCVRITSGQLLIDMMQPGAAQRESIVPFMMAREIVYVGFRSFRKLPVAEHKKLHMILLSGKSALRSEREVAAQSSARPQNSFRFGSRKRRFRDTAMPRQTASSAAALFASADTGYKKRRNSRGCHFLRHNRKNIAVKLFVFTKNALWFVQIHGKDAEIDIRILQNGR